MSSKRGFEKERRRVSGFLRRKREDETHLNVRGDASFESRYDLSKNTNGSRAIRRRSVLALKGSKKTERQREREGERKGEEKEGGRGTTDTHGVASKQGKELPKLSREIGSQHRSQGSNEVGSTRHEFRLLLRFLLLFVFLLVLTQTLSLEDAGGVFGDFGEI